MAKVTGEQGTLRKMMMLFPFSNQYKSCNTCPPESLVKQKALFIVKIKFKGDYLCFRPNDISKQSFLRRSCVKLSKITCTLYLAIDRMNTAKEKENQNLIEVGDHGFLFLSSRKKKQSCKLM